VLQLGQLGGGVESQLVDQRVAESLICVQCLGLAARPIQGQHQRGPSPLSQRLGGDRLLGHHAHLLVTAQRQADLKRFLYCGVADFLKMRSRKHGPFGTRSVSKRRAPPPGKSAAKHVSS